MEDLHHPSQCQALCANFTGCDFFSFEIQQSSPEVKCYLKAAYSDPTCVGYSTPVNACARVVLCRVAQTAVVPITSVLPSFADLTCLVTNVQASGTIVAMVRGRAGPAP
eukprot:1313883-Prymnesium_polylepis.1